jgi:hypothetical protein
MVLFVDIVRCFCCSLFVVYKMCGIRYPITDPAKNCCSTGSSSGSATLDAGSCSVPVQVLIILYIKKNYLKFCFPLDLNNKNCFHLDSFLYGPDEEERLVRYGIISIIQTTVAFPNYII